MFYEDAKRPFPGVGPRPFAPRAGNAPAPHPALPGAPRPAARRTLVSLPRARIPALRQMRPDQIRSYATLYLGGRPCLTRLCMPNTSVAHRDGRIATSRGAPSRLCWGRAARGRNRTAHSQSAHTFNLVPVRVTHASRPGLRAPHVEGPTEAPAAALVGAPWVVGLSELRMSGGAPSPPLLRRRPIMQCLARLEDNYGNYHVHVAEKLGGRKRERARRPEPQRRDAARQRPASSTCAGRAGPMASHTTAEVCTQNPDTANLGSAPRWFGGAGPLAPQARGHPLAPVVRAWIILHLLVHGAISHPPYSPPHGHRTGRSRGCQTSSYTSGPAHMSRRPNSLVRARRLIGSDNMRFANPLVYPMPLEGG